MRRLQGAGGDLIGKTTTPEFGWKALGDSPLTGDTRNPWNTAHDHRRLQRGRGRGGRGGPRAARTTARTARARSACRRPSAASSATSRRTAACRSGRCRTTTTRRTTGPMTRTVADAALMLSVMAGPDDWDRTSLEAAPADYVGKLDRGVQGPARGVEPRPGRAARGSRGRRGREARRRAPSRSWARRSRRSRPRFADTHD